MKLSLDPDTLYEAKDPALEALGSYSTLASWRTERRGPPWYKVAGRVYYRGRDILAWLETQRVEPSEATEAA